MTQLFDFLKNTKTQAILAYLIIGCGFALISFVKLSDTVSNRIFDLMFLTSTFYFGSSKSGATKDEAINTLTQQLPDK